MHDNRFYFFDIFFFFFIYFIPWARYASKDMQCKSHLFSLACFLHYYYETNNTFPNHVDAEGMPSWSWRSIVLSSLDDELINQLQFNEPWNSPSNMPVVQKLDPLMRSVYCCFLMSGNKSAAYVAVSGEGTAWDKISKEHLQPQECPEMIVLIEAPHPKNHWAEPGDDLSPDEVIRMYTEYKASKSPLLAPRRHPAKYFITIGLKLGSFDDIKNVEDLKKRLIISPT